MGVATADGDRVGNLRVWLRFEHSLAVTRKQAASVLVEARTADAASEAVELEVAGRDLVTGLPRTILLLSDEVHAASEQPALPW
jgi:rod shape-determining protein MreB